MRRHQRCLLTAATLFNYPICMRVRVLLFGVLKDIFHRGSDMIELPEGATLRELLDRYRQESPEHGNLWRALALSVNQQYASIGQVLHEGDEVGLLPPVSGGSGDPATAQATRLQSEH